MGIVSAVNRAAYFYGFTVTIRPRYSASEERIEFATKTGINGRKAGPCTNVEKSAL